MPTVAITTTARNIDRSLSEWCNYHLHLVDHIFIWLDDPHEGNSSLVPSHNRIRVEVGAQCSGKSVHGNLMHRQIENANRAVYLCCTRGIEWLIHIDIDELLFPPDRSMLHRNLDAHLGHITLPNHEVCPRWSADSPFRQCHHFKLNGRLRFNFYGNGKAAVRCRPGVYALGAHSFAEYSGGNRTSPDIAVLHYACATYDRWLRKYAHLGDFPDFWWDDPQHRIELPFHLKSRDVYRQCVIEGTFDHAVGFWKRQVLSDDQLNQLLQDGRVGWYAPMAELHS